MRIAWIGPMPNGEGGASGVSNQLLRELNKFGDVHIDCYVPGDENALPSNLKNLKNVRFICGPSAWQWGRWYSRNRLMSFITGQVANLRCENRLAYELVAEHRCNAYDVIYQFSHIEFSVLRKFRKELPPIVLHPSVHAFGELRWHRAEAHLSRTSEPWLMRLITRCLLTARSLVQKRHIRLPDLVLGLSRNFAMELIEDYGVPPSKVKIVPNPIDLEAFKPDVELNSNSDRMPILFVSRIAVRKGVEMIVELSHRLDDLQERIEIQVVGDRSQWSDYTGLLRNLNPRIARHTGAVGSKEIRKLYQKAGMLIQPSRYEPFGLTVGEALACGVPVVSSDKVGAAEGVDPLACRVFKDGDINHLEHEVRVLVSDMSDPQTARQIRWTARGECERLYNGRQIALQLLQNLLEPLGTQPNSKRIAMPNNIIDLSME